MKLNENTVLQTSRLLLVPYESRHVPNYHEWMKSVELQQLTASEPLSLEDEYKMQKSWREDTDKLTFILLDRSHLESTNDEIASMIGDVNAFFHLNEDNSLQAELEVMLAELKSRGRGLGSEAIVAMMKYVKVFFI